MSFLKRYGTKLLLFVGEVLILLFLLTVLYYFDILSDEAYSFFKLLIVLLSILYNSFQLGKTSQKKGYKEGLKYGLLCILFLFFISLLFTNFHLKSILYYALLLATSILGSIIGISRRKES